MSIDEQEKIVTLQKRVGGVSVLRNLRGTEIKATLASCKGALQRQAVLPGRDGSRPLYLLAASVGGTVRDRLQSSCWLIAGRAAGSLNRAAVGQAAANHSA